MDQLILRGKLQSLKYSGGQLEQHFKEFDDIVNAGAVSILVKYISFSFLFSVAPTILALRYIKFDIDKNYFNTSNVMPNHVK